MWKGMGSNKISLGFKRYFCVISEKYEISNCFLWLKNGTQQNITICVHTAVCHEHSIGSGQQFYSYLICGIKAMTRNFSM